MSDMPTTEAIWSMTPAEATAELARQTIAYQATQRSDLPDKPASELTPEQAQQKLDKLGADKSFFEKLNAGDVEARREFAALTTRISQQDRLEQILAGNDEPLLFQTVIGVSAGGDGNHDSLLRTFVEQSREVGLNDQSVRQLLERNPASITAEQRQLAADVRREISSPEFRKRLFDGDPKARLLHDIVCGIEYVSGGRHAA